MLLEEFFQYLHHSDICNVGAVCTTLRADSERTWRKALCSETKQNEAWRHVVGAQSCGPFFLQGQGKNYSDMTDHEVFEGCRKAVLAESLRDLFER